MRVNTYVKFHKCMYVYQKLEVVLQKIIFIRFFSSPPNFHAILDSFLRIIFCKVILYFNGSWETLNIELIQMILDNPTLKRRLRNWSWILFKN